MVLPKQANFFFGNCGNGIAEIGEIFFWVIVAMPLPKMGGAIMEWNCGNAIAEIGEI